MENSLSKRYAFRALFTICTTSFCASGITWSTISLYAAPVVEDLGITPTQFMFMLTLLVIINAAASIFLYGSIISRIGVRRGIIMGSTLLAAAQAIWAGSQSLWMLYLGAVVMGFGIITITANTQVLVLNGWFTKRGGTYIGIANTVGSVSGMVCAAIYGTLILILGWRLPFLITCAVDTIGLILVIFLFKGMPDEVGVKPLYADADTDADQPQAEEAETGIGLKEMIRTPKFYILCVTYFIVGVVGYGVMGNLALMLSEFGRGAFAGTAVSVTMLGSAITMTLCGYMCDKVGSKWFVSLAMFMVAIAMMILRITDVNIVLVYVAAALVGIGYNATQFTAGLATKEIYGTKEYEKKVGLIHGCNLFGLGFGPTILQIIRSAVGSYETTMVILSIAALAAIALLIINVRPIKEMKNIKEGSAVYEV